MKMIKTIFKVIAAVLVAVAAVYLHTYINGFSWYSGPPPESLGVYTTVPMPAYLLSTLAANAVVALGLIVAGSFFEVRFARFRPGFLIASLILFALYLLCNLSTFASSFSAAGPSQAMLDLSAFFLNLLLPLGDLRQINTLYLIFSFYLMFKSFLRVPQKTKKL